MSIQSEIDRIKGNVTDSLSAIRGTGVNVPDGSNSNDLPNLINDLANTRQRVVNLGTLSFSTHGSYENSAQLTEEQMDEIFSSEDPPVLLFTFDGTSIVNSVALDAYKQTTRRAMTGLVTSGSEGVLSLSRMEIGYYSGSFEGPLVVISNDSYFSGTSDEGALVAAKQIKLPSDPTQPMEAATKQYVDIKTGELSAVQVSYNNVATGMTATDVQSAITELFTSASEGKALVAAAVTGKGVQTAADASYEQIAANVTAIETGGGTATIQVNLGQAQNPDYGIYYVSPDGTSSFKDLSTAPFSIQVKNNSFVLPVVPFDMDQYYLSGGLSVIQGTKAYSDFGNNVQYLIYVSGDGAVSGPN